MHTIEKLGRLVKSFVNPITSESLNIDEAKKRIKETKEELNSGNLKAKLNLDNLGLTRIIHCLTKSENYFF